MAREIPPEGTVIWVWVSDTPPWIPKGPIQCRVGTHWHDRDVQAHVLDSKDWVWLDGLTIFSESREECIQAGMEKETRRVEGAREYYEKELSRFEGLKAKWLT